MFGMKKDFNNWNRQKTNLHDVGESKLYHEREVWWCSLGLNIGFEQDGKGEDFSRPILIIKGFSRDVFLCVPLTTKNKEGKYYCDIVLEDKLSRKVILSQIRLVDSKRLQEKICRIDRLQFAYIKQNIIRIIE